MKFRIEAKDNSVAQIYVYGYLSDYDITSQDFAAQFNELANKYGNIEIRLNCGGGSIFQGVAIFNLIRNSKINVTCYIDGLAASMGSVLAMAGTKVYMSRYARLMIHRPSGVAEGDADDMDEYKNLLVSLENDLSGIYAERTGMTVKEVKDKWMKKGIDKWFTAEEALKAKLIDGIYDGVEINEPLKDAKYNPKDMWNFYNTINYNQNENNMKNLGKFIALFAMANVVLPVDATEDMVVIEMEKLVNKHKQLLGDFEKVKGEKQSLEDKLKEAGKEKVKNLIDGAIASGRIQEAQRATYTSLAEGNFDATKAAIDAITPYRSISSQMAGKIDEEDNRKDWTFEDFTKKDPKALAEIKNNDPERFKKLKAAYIN